MVNRKPFLIVLAVGLAGSRSLAPAAEPKLEFVVQTGHTNLVSALTWSGDGQRVLTGSIDGTAILWDARASRS
jgi:WD40 repeat protein